jgi:hypothetical protein
LRSIEAGSELRGQRIQLVEHSWKHMVAHLDRSAQLAPLDQGRNICAVEIEYLLSSVAPRGGLQRKAL